MDAEVGVEMARRVRTERRVRADRREREVRKVRRVRDERREEESRLQLGLAKLAKESMTPFFLSPPPQQGSQGSSRVSRGAGPGTRAWQDKCQ